jgi:hypothetical protein
MLLDQPAIRQVGTTQISAANYPAFNLYLNHPEYRVLAAYAVLRKIYL